ncbi:toll/interleukin-1 receptor domain-containing protein [Nonomuraea lactucae]|uniref:toll/interleukin-1 receptor domain-containing protein n=1 Tax=Nonomuraea lactucae TaxID=2249762 RepID=UPI0013B39E8E|nr:toll/interleukin-1 receptor domain-containing protein [Nonomuraea lactucae]
MAGVFINYRGLDNAWAVLLDRELNRRFGEDVVFRAGRSIRPSEDFAERLLAAVRKSDILIAVIGPRWLTAASRSGRRLLDDEKDWVRREIAEAFRCGIPVLPVLVEDAAFPPEDQLPPDIARLARCQHLRLHHRNADYDIARLVAELHHLVPALPPAAPASSPRSWGRRALLVAVPLAAAAVAGVVYATWPRTTTDAAPPATGSPGTTSAATGTPPATAAPPSAGSPRTGRADLGPEDHLDFESGTVGDAISGLDLYFPTESTPLPAHLVGAVGNAAFAPTASAPKSAPTKESCSHALAARQDTTVDVRALGVGGAFCVRTTEGNIAAARIAHYTPANPQRLTLDFTSWS